MSGGAFDYAFYKVDIFACELQNRLDERDRKDEWGYTPNAVSDTAFATLKEIQHEAERLSKLMREVEWFYSGDTGEDTFLSRVEELNKGTAKAVLREIAEAKGFDNIGKWARNKARVNT